MNALLLDRLRRFQRLVPPLLAILAWAAAAYAETSEIRVGLSAALAGCAAVLWRRSRRRRIEAEQKQLEETRLRLTWTRAVLEPIEEGLLALGPDGRPTFSNQRFWEMLGRRRDSASTSQLSTLLGEPAAASFEQAVERAMADERDGEDLEWTVARPDGSSVTLACTLRPIDSGGLRLGWLAAFRDVSRERRVERSRRVLAQRLEFLFREMPLACILWDLDFRVAEWNSTATRIFGWSGDEARGRSYRSLFSASQSDEMASAWNHVRQGLGSRQVECRHLTRSKSMVEMEWFHTALLNEDGAVVGVASMGNDITRRLQLEQELAQSQKMEAVGALAGGIAHDFNNLLTAILGNLSMLQLQFGSSHPAAKGLKDGVQAAERAAELTRQLLRFSRRSLCELRPVDLRDRIEDSVRLFRMGLERNLELHCSIADDLWQAEADGTQIAQVLMNLLVNARDASPEGGRVEIRARNRRLSDDELSQRSWAAGAEYIEIEVRDSGAGIEPEIRDRIFEPFFTTKPVGKGTGLGLATAYAIVQRHRGGIEVESEQGRGATFRVLLPRYAADRQARSASPGGRVLLVEPDPWTASEAGVALESAGYTPVLAATYEDGVKMLREESTRLSLAILALRLPDGGGGRLLAEARQLRPDLPVLVTSERILESFSEPGAALLRRPFSREELSAAVRTALCEPGSE